MNGIYGTVKPAKIDSSDVDIFYSYRPSRSIDTTTTQTFEQIESTILQPSTMIEGNGTTILNGMYDLRLPLSRFGNVGIYTIYIKPKEVRCNITDIGQLTAYDDIFGIVINTSTLNGSLPLSDNSLVGYRVEYFEDNGTRRDECRIITSSNTCEPVSQNMGNGKEKGVSYSFNPSSNLIFCTVTPSTVMPFQVNDQANRRPWIGNIGQEIAIINTKFNPVCLEIEIVEHDIETITTMLEGNQIRNLDAGLITTFNSEGNIYNQSMYANIENPKKAIHHDIKIKNTDVISVEEKDKYDAIINELNS